MAFQKLRSSINLVHGYTVFRSPTSPGIFQKYYCQSVLSEISRYLLRLLSLPWCVCACVSMLCPRVHACVCECVWVLCYIGDVECHISGCYLLPGKIFQCLKIFPYFQMAYLVQILVTIMYLHIQDLGCLKASVQGQNHQA